MRTSVLAGLVLAVLATSGHAQDETPPPVPVEETGGEQQQEEQAQEQQGPPPAEQGSEPAVLPPAPADDAPAALAHPTVVWPMSAETIAEHLRLIASAHPECARLETLGTSAGGRPILALRLGANGPAPVLFLAEHRGSASAAPEAMLEVAWRLAQAFAQDENVRTLLTSSALVLAPALDPDRRAVGEPPAVRFELNFPSGWQPESVRPGAGRTSLSKPEALAVARYLAELSSASVVLGFTERLPRGKAYAGAQQPEEDRAVHENLCTALELPGAGAPVTWYELGSPGGGLLDFAYQARGLFALALPLPGEDQLVAGGAADYVEPLLAWATKCLALLPRVELSEEGLERLASDTWQLDVRIQNAGLVPTQSAVLCARERGADVALELAGAKLVATAKKPTPQAPYTDASFQAKSPLSAGTLAGGEGRWLRLILEAESGAAVSVASGSLWAGTDKLELVLP